MKIQSKLLAAGLLLSATTFSQAAIVGDVTGGGSFSGTLSSGDGWGTNNGTGVDFWTLTLTDDNQLSVSVNGAFDYGISIYEGTVESDFFGEFDSDGDYSYNFGADQAVYVAGTPDLFGPFNAYSTLLGAPGTYTIAVGGVNGSFQSMDYDMDVQVVPVPAAFWLFGSALLGMMGLRKRRC